MGFGPFLGALRADFTYRNTYGRSTNPLLNGLYTQWGVGLTASTAIVGLKAEFEWVPLAILRVRASYSALAYTGIAQGLGHGLTFVDAESPFDGPTLEARKGEERFQFVHRMQASLTLRFKVGVFIAFSDFEFSGWYIPENAEPGYGYDSYYDTLIKRGALDGTFMNRTAVLVEAWKGKGDANFRVGVVHQYVRAFDTGFERSRLGGLVLFTPWHKLAGIRAPTLLLASGVTLMDENRKGDFWMEFALIFNWDL